MFSSLFLISALASSAHASLYGLGTSWSIGASGSSSKIVKVTTTLNPGTPPSGQYGELLLYPALSNGTGDFLFSSVASEEDQSWCGANSDEWCIQTSVFSNEKSYLGASAPLAANTPITFTFEQFTNQSGWSIEASVNGKVISQLSYPSGPMTVFGFTTECDDYCTMTVSPQTYTNTVIELETAISSFGATAVKGDKVYGDDTTTSGQQPPSMQGMSSSQDGKIWTISEIVIPAY